MNSVLFFPLNTNHVLIFQTIIRHLKKDYIFLSHDYVSESKQYQTGKLLGKLDIPYMHFPKKIVRSITDNTILKILKFFRIRQSIRELLRDLRPKVIVLGIDNDPLSQILINEAKRNSIKTLLLQEALIRPLEYTMRRKYKSDYLMSFLRKLGFYLNYIPLGSGGCDKILLGGKRPAEILMKRGIDEKSLEITGLPKYDAIAQNISTPKSNMKIKENSFLFIASTLVVKDNENIHFLKTLVDIIEKNKLNLLIKLHPRTVHEPEDIYKILNKTKNEYFHILKQGDKTSTLLEQVCGMITVSSTVVLDALLMNKKCIIVDYLAGEAQLKYEPYDAVFQISRKEDIESVLKDAIKEDKADSNKKRLLEAELYKLDGQSGKRVADFINNYIAN